MNLAEALAHVAAMSPAEKAAWDQANGFTTDAMREMSALKAYERLEHFELPHHTYVTPDVLGTLCAEANNLLIELEQITATLRIWPGDPDQNFPSEKEWLDPA